MTKEEPSIYYWLDEVNRDLKKCDRILLPKKIELEFGISYEDACLIIDKVKDAYEIK